MSYNDSRGFTDTQDNQKNFNEKYVDNDPGPYIATVKVTNDPLKMGRLGVNIPAITLTTKPGPEQIIWCQYLSPFYGAKSIEAVTEIEESNYKESQNSYGMWAVPPDIDTEVLVIFAKGEQSNATAFWIGCVQKPLVNQQLPANGSTGNTLQSASTNRELRISKQKNYGTNFLPSGEKNQRMYKSGEVLSSVDSWRTPINNILADQLEAEGLVQDNVRGTTSSSARRESPSRVFGINTPGAIREDSRLLNIGLNKSTVRPDRNPGHSFVMDDGAVDGTNQLTRIRTASGHQLLLHDTEGTVYIANGSGKAFIEMDRDGTISVYSDSGINMRTGQDFNLHSDKNINFHAKESINFTSEKNVALNAEEYVFTMGQKGILNSSQGGSVRNFGRDGITSFTSGQQLHGASGSFHLAGSQVHFNSIGASSSWGPGWLKPDAIGIKVTDGLIDIDDGKPLDNGRVVKVENKTTVSEFVTHEPYDRQSSTARIKKYINQSMDVIKAENPKLTAQELKDIKTQLLKKTSINAVADQLSKIVKLNTKINIPITKFNTLIANARNLDSLIKNNIKSQAINFVQGQIASLKNQAISAVRSFFRF